MVDARIDAGRPDTRLIAEAAEIVRNGGLVAYPTDTLYGLAADPASRAAIAQLYRIKGRPVEQAIPLIAAGIDQVEGCAGALNPMARTLAQRFWPGPVTIVIPAWAGLDARVLAGGATVAIRVPAHPVARLLAAACGWPITSTSANRSGGRAAVTADEIRMTFGDELEGILDGGTCPGGAPSTIVDVSGPEPRLVRPGAVPWERVLECLR